MQSPVDAQGGIPRNHSRGDIGVGQTEEDSDVVTCSIGRLYSRMAHLGHVRFFKSERNL